MMTVGRAGCGFLILISIARAAAAQSVSANGTHADSINAIVALVADREASAELAKIVAATEQNGLPIHPILAKVRYAVIVAHAPAPRIVAAARAVAARLEEARSALAPHPTPPDIMAGEAALLSGVSTKSLQEIRKLSANKPVVVPLGVLAQLVSSNVPEKSAAKYVTDLIKRGASVDQLATLGNDVNADVKLGTAATSALELRMNRLNAVLGAPGANGDALSLPASIQQGDGKKKP
jgi:predicted FMN-binding regulatory protein PaiB